MTLVIDTDDFTIDQRTQEVTDFIEKEGVQLTNCDLVVIPQNRCIETWFPGNRRVYKANPQSGVLADFVRFYNVKDNDPEEMGVHSNYNTHAQFHADYCTEFLRERNIKYSKNRPNGVVEKPYLDELIGRIEETDDLTSFRFFIEFCNRINDTI